MKKLGFTFVEIITVIAIIGILSISSFSVYTVWQNKNKVSTARTIVVQALSEAKQRALIGSNDNNWGVKYQTGKIVLFSGLNYLERDATKDVNFDLPSGVVLNNLDEVTFYKFTGLSVNKPTIIIIYGSESQKITISETGVFGN